MNAEKDKAALLRDFKNLSGKSMQYLTNEAYKVLGNPLIVCMLDWEIVAYAEDAIIDDPIWNQHLKDKTINNRTKDFSVSEGYSDAMSGPKPVVLFHSDNLKYDRFVGKIYDEEGITIAFMFVVASDRPFEDGDAILVADICQKFSEEMRKSGAYEGFGQKIMEHFINKLIYTDIQNDIYAIHFMELVYCGLKNYLFAAVVNIPHDNTTCARLEHYRDLFKKAQTEFKYSIYVGHIIIIMSTDDCNISPPELLAQHNDLFKQNNIQVGISSRFENLFYLPKYYNEALEALNNGLKADSGQQVFVYDDENNACCG